jgi:hypothetical protein
VPASESEVANGDPGIPIVCEVAGSTWLSVSSREIVRLRAEVAAAYSQMISVGTLKQTDEQCLVALLGLREAIDDTGLNRSDLENWALVATPRTLSRKRISESIAKFREQGVWSMSPHLIPHTSLHSLPGLLSQALQQHGPNLGAGGLPGRESESLWAALPFLCDSNCPGVWLVLTGWNRESIDANETFCQAAVLGLRAASAHSCRPQFCFQPSSISGGDSTFTLESLGQAIQQQSTTTWELDGARCSLSYFAAEMEIAA